MLTIKIGEVVWVPVPSFVVAKRGTGSEYVRCGIKREIGVVTSIPTHDRDRFTILLRDQEITQASAHELWPVIEYTRDQVFAYLKDGGPVLTNEDIAKVDSRKGRIRSNKEAEKIERGGHK